MYCESRNTVTLVASLYISSKRCEINIIEQPSSLSCSVILYNSSHSLFERAAVGSSIMIIFAFVEIAFAISTICCSATVRLPILECGSMSLPNLSKSAFASLCICFQSIVWNFVIFSCPMKMFSVTLKC